MVRSDLADAQQHAQHAQRQLDEHAAQARRAQEVRATKPGPLAPKP